MADRSESTGTEVRRRRRRRPGAPGMSAEDWLARVPYMLVLSGVGAGLLLCSLNYFRRGSVLIAAALLFGALARLVLPEARLRMLAIRSRAIDAWTLVIFGEVVAFVALSVPPVNKTGLMIAAGTGVLIFVVFVVRGVRFLLSRHGAGQAQV